MKWSDCRSASFEKATGFHPLTPFIVIVQS
uniref:Uncharacterized protein n=1 Tax=Peronospora matthiolae TaxID=2874970 RepID=A0AAV1UH37_9STRA